MAKNTTTLSNGVQVWVSTMSGEVMSSDRSSSTSVHQTAALPDGKGNMIPGKVYSVVHNTHEVWLRAPNGREDSFDLSSLNLPVRVGHQLTVAWGGAGEAGPILGAYNHATREAAFRKEVRGLTGIATFASMVSAMIVSPLKWGLPAGVIGAVCGALVYSLAERMVFLDAVLGGAFLASMPAGFVGFLAAPGLWYTRPVRELLAFARKEFDAARSAHHRKLDQAKASEAAVAAPQVA